MTGSGDGQNATAPMDMIGLITSDIVIQSFRSFRTGMAKSQIALNTTLMSEIYHDIPLK